MSKIAFFGVTANPPHVGHVDAVSQVGEEFDKVWVSPVYSHAFNKPGIIPYDSRAIMTNYVFNHFVPKKYCDKILVKELDLAYYECHKETPIYTYKLLKWLSKINPGDEITLILGQDNKAMIDKYYESQKLQKEFSIFYAKEKIGLHSTNIRDYLKEINLESIAKENNNVKINNKLDSQVDKSHQKVKLLTSAASLDYLYSVLGPKATKYILSNSLYEESKE